MSLGRIVLIGGPTASGKSALAVQLAQSLGGEVINADSQQVYRGMDIGTGKPTPAEQGGVAHHLFDLVEPWEQLDAAQFVARADAAIAQVMARGRLPIVVGGTGLWLRALLFGLVEAPPRDAALRAQLEAEGAAQGWPALHARLAGLDPLSAARIGATDPVRIVRALEVVLSSGLSLAALHDAHAGRPPRYEAIALRLDAPMELLEPRIARRVAQMFEGGLVAETQRLLCDARSAERLARVMGYREALQLIDGRLRPAEAQQLVVRAQRQYARRQRTWFKAERHWRVIELPVDAAAIASLVTELRRG